MKNKINQLAVLLLVGIAMFQLSVTNKNSTSQKVLGDELDFEVHQVYQPLAIAKNTFLNAKTLTDLNQHYRASWVKKYISVSIAAIHQGQLKQANSKNDTLTQEQQSLIKRADVGTEISISVKYIPDNTLSHNEPKEINFTFTVEPKQQAKYKTGQSELLKYLKEKAIDKIPNDIFKGYALAAVKFTIDEQGQVINAHIFESSRNEKTDKLLLDALQQMPHWQPAAYENGTKVKQEFALMVGNMESCVVNLLNIRRTID